MIFFFHCGDPAKARLPIPRHMPSHIAFEKTAEGYISTRTAATIMSTPCADSVFPDPRCRPQARVLVHPCPVAHPLLRQVRLSHSWWRRRRSIIPPSISTTHTHTLPTLTPSLSTLVLPAVIVATAIRMYTTYPQACLEAGCDERQYTLALLPMCCCHGLGPR